MNPKNKLHNSITDEDASVTVEFVLWIPVIFLFLFATAQISLLFVAQSNYYRVAQETARLVARHALDTTSAASYAQDQAALFGTNPTANVSMDGSIVNVTLSIPAFDISPFNPLGLEGGFQIEASINHTMEPL